MDEGRLIPLDAYRLRKLQRKLQWVLRFGFVVRREMDSSGRASRQAHPHTPPRTPPAEQMAGCVDFH